MELPGARAIAVLGKWARARAAEGELKLLDSDGLLQSIMKQMIEAVLEAELGDHLACPHADKSDGASNERNGWQVPPALHRETAQYLARRRPRTRLLPYRATITAGPRSTGAFLQSAGRGYKGLASSVHGILHAADSDCCRGSRRHAGRPSPGVERMRCDLLPEVPCRAVAVLLRPHRWDLVRHSLSQAPTGALRR